MSALENLETSHFDLSSIYETKNDILNTNIQICKYVNV